MRVYELQAGSLDEAYLDVWSARLEVAAALAVIRKQARVG